jgi:catechol 2,3-dioxygenase-like lactoylglutathione lyase family enzyme
MIQRISHTSVLVLDQDQARDFYVNKLGFDVIEDATMGDFRWLTVAPKGQRDVAIILMPLKPNPMWDRATVDTLKKLVTSGKCGGGVFEVDDCRKTYEELKAKGVTFQSAQQERPYGIEALMADNSGNWFSVVERPKK